MTPNSSAAVNPHEILAVLNRRRRLWLVPAVVGAILAGGYGLVRPTTWKAVQALLVRDEAAGGQSRDGRFDSSDAMKTAQETIVEIAKNRTVVASAIEEIARQEGRSLPEGGPTAAEIEQLQASISVTAPKGAEFGRTEVIYLATTGATRDQALQRTSAVSDRLLAHLQELRNRKAQSMIHELAKAAGLAEADLDAATKHLQNMETQVGSDLGELRILNDSASGDSNLRSNLNQIKNELRSVRSVRDANDQQRQLLEAAQLDAGKLVATPNSLLESQPALRRLKDGLVDAQLRTAQLLGKMSRDHPEVQAAEANEQIVRKHLHDELEVALRGLIAELTVGAAQIKSLERQQAEVEARLDRLAALRARYGNLVSEVKNRAGNLEQAEKDLADARASQAAALSSSLIAKLDEPATGNKPIGPGFTAIVASGFGGGLMVGLGLVFLVSPLGRSQGRRFSDYFRKGRRATDAEATGKGRRASDLAAGSKRRASDVPEETAASAPSTAPISAPVQEPRQRAKDEPARDDSQQAPPAAAPLSAPLPHDDPLVELLRGGSWHK